MENEFKVGERVVYVGNIHPVYPEYIGAIGKITSFHGFNRNRDMYRVQFEGGTAVVCSENIKRLVSSW